MDSATPASTQIRGLGPLTLPQPGTVVQGPLPVGPRSKSVVLSPLSSPVNGTLTVIWLHQSTLAEAGCGVTLLLGAEGVNGPSCAPVE